MRERGFAHLLLIFVVLLAGSLFFYFYSKNFTSFLKTLPARVPSASREGINTHSKQQLPDNHFFLTEIPKPIENLEISQLPDYRDIRDVVEYKGHLLISGEGSIIEYDPATSKIMHYSDPRKAYCSRSLALIQDNLYAACRPSPSTDMDHSFLIYKISLKDYSLQKIFGFEDGLTNRDNLQLIGSKGLVWIGTYNGLGVIDDKTDKLDFYQGKALGLTVDNMYVEKIMATSDKIWVSIPKTNYDCGGGGLIMFNKNENSKTVFFPSEVRGEGNDCDFFAVPVLKEIPGGVEIAVNTTSQQVGSRNIRRFYYSTDKWETVKRLDAESPEFKKYEEENTVYQGWNAKEDSRGLTELVWPGTDKIIDLKGRDNGILSPEINGKRYILTNGTIDVLDNSLPYPQIIAYIGENLVYSNRDRRMSEWENLNEISFAVEGKSLVGVVVYAERSPTQRSPTQRSLGVYYAIEKIWVIDLKTGKILTHVQNKNGDPLFRNIKNSNLSTEHGVLYPVTKPISLSLDKGLIKVKDKKEVLLFTFNTKDNSIHFLD